MTVYTFENDDAIEGEVMCATLKEARDGARAVAASGEQSTVTRHTVSARGRETLAALFNRDGWSASATDLERWEPVGDGVRDDDDTGYASFTYRVRRVTL